MLIKLFHFIELRRAGERQSVCVTVKQIKWDLGKLENTHNSQDVYTQHVRLISLLPAEGTKPVSEVNKS